MQSSLVWYLVILPNILQTDYSIHITHAQAVHTRTTAIMFTACCSKSSSPSLPLLLAQCMASGMVHPGGKTNKHNTVKPLIADPPKSGQPLYSGHITCPRLILP